MWNSLFRKLLFLVLFFCTGTNALKAQLLWKVIPPNGGPALHILGTMHWPMRDFLKDNVYIQEAIKSSDIVYTEMSLDQPDISDSILRYIFLPPGMHLSDSLNEREKKVLDSIFSNIHWHSISADFLDTCKPIYAMLMAYNSQSPYSDSLLQEAQLSSVDKLVVDFAKGENKELRYFETAGEQLKYLFEDPPLPLQFRLLRSSLNQKVKPNSLTALADKLPDYYKKQDLDTLALIINHLFISDEDTRLLFLSLLDARNKKWITDIEHFVSVGRHSAFIAVGAAHLIGEKGLLAMLRNKGYSVQPVMK